MDKIHPHTIFHKKSFYSFGQYYGPRAVGYLFWLLVSVSCSQIYFIELYKEHTETASQIWSPLFVACICDLSLSLFSGMYDQMVL